GNGGDLFAGGACRTQGGDADLDHPTGLEHLIAGEAVQGREEMERLGFERRWAVGDERAGPVTRLDDAHRRQCSQAYAHRRAADAGLQGEGALGWQAIAGPQFTALE